MEEIQNNFKVSNGTKKSDNKAFTLVELLVVLGILAILSVVGMMSWQSVAKDSRNSTRLTNLKTIESGLKIQFTQGGAYAVPDDYVTTTASGTEIRKQGVFGNTGIRTIKASTNASTDPLTKEYYTYVTDRYLQQYQLVGNMEGENVAYHKQTPPLSPLLEGETEHSEVGGVANASTLTGYTMKSLGADLGIIYSGSTEMHKSYTGSFDVRREPEISGNSYRIVFSEGDEITSSSGSELFSNIYNRDKILLQNKDLAKLDDSLVLYFDMETTTMSGSLKVLKDLSQYGNNGKCYKYNSLYDCGKTYLDNVEMLGFSGSESHIDISSSFTGIINSTLIFSTYILGDQKGYNGAVFTSGNWNNAGNHWSFGVGQNNKYLGLRGIGSTFQTVINPILSIGKKNILFLIRDNDKFHYWLNGIYGNSVNITPISTMSHLNNSYIGKADYGYNQNYFPYNGNIGFIKYFNRALSEKEIKTIYGSTIK